MSQTLLTDCFFTHFNLHPLLQQGLDEAGFTRCTPIQALTLPVALADRDLVGQAQTGTGKTCAFMVALMNRLLSVGAVNGPTDGNPRALVIAPTRELAIQIDAEARMIGARSGLKTVLVYGGVDYEKQRRQLGDGCDIMIATPGRLIDYYRQKVVGFNGVEVMVVDEADRMFDLGFIRDVRFIFRLLPMRGQRQVLLFSATLSHRVLDLSYEYMHEAEKLVVEANSVTADKVRQCVYFPAREEKLPLLLNLLARKKPQCSLVFVNTKALVERLSEQLRRHGYRVGALSGDVPQLKRQKMLQRFRHHQLDLLVCTDVAARGLHIPAVSHVFNYDLPQDARDYVHRVGRTARLDAEGDAISFACELYAMSLPEIEHYIDQKISSVPLDPALLLMPGPVQIHPSATTMISRRVVKGDRHQRHDGSDLLSRPARRRRGRSAPHVLTHTPPVEASSTVVPIAASTLTGHEAKVSVPLSRRQRWGGHHRHRSGESASPDRSTGSWVSTASPAVPRPGRAHAEPGSGAHDEARAGSISSSSVKVSRRRPLGFFRRLSRLFTGH